MTEPLRVGTRASHLAMVQTGQIVEQLRKLGLDVVIETISTRGDTRGDQPVAALGADGVFVRELERALLDGRIDVAVHSLKDMPTAPVAQLTIACVPARATPFDALVSRAPVSLESLPPGAVIGTSSIRRITQLAAARPDVIIKPIRGNIDTRLGRLDAGDFDALVLAAAGLERIGLGARATILLAPPLFWPAVGQGALGLQIREDDDVARAAVARLDDRETHAAVLAERSCLAELAGGCLAPVAAYATFMGGRLLLGARVLEQAGSEIREMTIEDESDVQLASIESLHASAQELGRRIAMKLLESGASDMLARMRSKVIVG